MPPLPADLSPAQLHRGQRWTNTLWATHQNFSAGQVSDVPSALVPEGGVYYAQNVLCDVPGCLRTRGPITSPTGSTTTPTLVQVGGFQSGTLEDSKAIYGLPATGATIGLKVNSINTATGAFTGMQATLPAFSQAITSGRPFKHFANLLFPQVNLAGAAFSMPVVVGGATTTKTATTGTAGTITAGSDSITGLVAINPTTQMELGGYVYITDGSGTKNVYLGRVIELTSSTAMRVEPTPTISFTATSVIFATTWSPVTSAGARRGGVVGCSFQNRILLANIHDWGAGSPSLRPRRVIYTILPNETSSLDLGVPQVTQGYKQLLCTAFEDNNYFEIPSADPITALAPIGEGDLIIFTKSECFRLTGTLTTQNTATEPGAPPFDVRKISSTIGCISEASIQQTPRGLVFAARDGVYAYDGAQFHPLMQGKVQLAYLAQLFAHAVAGSAMVRANHYLISFADLSFGLLVNLDTLAWSTIVNPCGSIWDSVVDPTVANGRVVWAVRWYNTASPVNQVGGQLVRLDQVMDSSLGSGTQTDADGASITVRIDTKYYTETDQETIKNFRRVQIEYATSTAAITLQRNTANAEAGVSYTTILNLSPPADTRRTVSGVYATVRSIGVVYRVTTTSYFEFYALKHSFAPIRVGRSS